MRVLRRAPLQFQASAPRDREARLEDLLIQWGDWTRGYDPSVKQRSGAVAEAFAFARSAYVELMDFLLPADRETMRAVDKCIDSIGAHEYKHKLVLHWHYAHCDATAPAVWRHARLPAFGSSEYGALLDAARGALLAKMLLERMTHLLDG